MSKITIETIKENLAAYGWEVLTPEYKNLDFPMSFKCDEGHTVTTPWKKIRNKPYCPICNENQFKNAENITVKRKPKGVHRILALDQATYKTGWSVYDDAVLVAYGVHSTTLKEEYERMLDMTDWLASMIHLWNPDEVGLEETQYQPKKDNHNTFRMLSQLMGGLMITILREKKILSTVLVSTWRGHCGVKGRARADQKRSAQLLVKEWYDVSVTDDESDAICIGKYFAETHKSSNDIVLGEWTM